MRVIRTQGYRQMPWKNGGGMTMEIAAAPSGAALGAFDWRISLARVERDGPFSRFPGIERTLCIVLGHGIELAVAGRPTVTLTGASEPYAFDGDAQASATLVDGTVTDLNVMTRRDAHRHVVRRRRVVESWEPKLGAALTGMVVVEGNVTVECCGQEATLDSLDTVLLSRQSATALVTTTRPTTVLHIEID